MFIFRILFRLLSVCSVIIFAAFLYMMFTPVTPVNVSFKIAGFCHANKISLSLIELPNIPPEIFGKLDCNCLSRNLIKKLGAERVAKASEAMRKIMVQGLKSFASTGDIAVDNRDKSQLMSSLAGFPENLMQVRASCLQAN